MNFGKKLQALRRKQGLSQEELAEKLSVTRQTISKWELEQSTPELQYISQISEIFGVTTDYLIKDVIDEPDKIAEKNDNNAEFSEKSTRGKADFPPFMGFLGIVLTLFGLIIIIAFIILSFVHPWETWNNYGYFTGLLGYLFGTGSMPYFIIGCIALISGITLYAIYTYRKK